MSNTNAASSSSGAVSHGAGSCISCNRCNKSLTTTLFVCACDCVFCQECTYEHFHTSSNCPSCNKTLRSNDFLELVIADPSSQKTTKATFQNLFTKYPTNKSSVVTHGEMCNRILKRMDDDRRTTKLLLKQLVHETAATGQTSGHLATDVQQLQAEITQLKQAHNTQRISHDEQKQELQHRVKALQGTIAQQDEQLAASDTQIAQFRAVLANPAGAPRVPWSSSSGSALSSGGGGKRGLQSQQPQQQSPMQGFVQQRQTLARQQQLNEMTRSRNSFHRATPPSTTGLLQSTPIVAGGGNGASVLVPYNMHRGSSMPRGGAHSSGGVVLPPTPRIRDFGTTNNSSRFTAAGSSSRSGGGGFLARGQYNNDSHKRHRVGLSSMQLPSTLFGG